LPILYLNYVSGAPGSSFLVEGYNFTPGATLTLRINDVLISSSIVVDQQGRFTLLLATLPNAVNGYYEVTATEGDPENPYPTPVPYPAPSHGGTHIVTANSTSGRNGYSLVAGAEVRAAPPNAPAAITVPTSISVTRYLFLPAIQR
jgi:hypothetical protein